MMPTKPLANRYVGDHERRPRERRRAQTTARVMERKQRRRPPLDRKEVALTIRNLNMLSRIDAEASSDLPITEAEVLNA